jgi:hypothetical protein
MRKTRISVTVGVEATAVAQLFRPEAQAESDYAPK